MAEHSHPPLRTGVTFPHARPSPFHQVYAAEWFISLGLTMIWPLFLEHAGHYGVWKALSEVRTACRVCSLFPVHSRSRFPAPAITCSADDNSSLIRPTHGDKLQPESHELSCTHNTPTLPERTHAACTLLTPTPAPLPFRSERKPSTSRMEWRPAPPVHRDQPLVRLDDVVLRRLVPAVRDGTRLGPGSFTHARPTSLLCSSLHYRYARSHFFFAFELIVLCVAYRLPHPPARLLLYTWPVWSRLGGTPSSPWPSSEVASKGSRSARTSTSFSCGSTPNAPTARRRGRSGTPPPSPPSDGSRRAGGRGTSLSHSSPKQSPSPAPPPRSSSTGLATRRSAPFSPSCTPPAARTPLHYTRAALMTIQAPSSDPRMGISFNRNLTS